MSPKVSVLMPVFNREAYLQASIDSILNQEFRDFEFIIIDDGSTDQSVAMIQSYMEQDARIQLIALAENAGQAHATNQGIKQAQGMYIALMDSDDLSMPLRLQQQVDYLDQHPDVGIIGTRMQVVDDDKNPLFIYDVPLEHSLIVWNLFFGWTFGHPSVMSRREVMQQIGGYNETLLTSKDVDLWARLVGHTHFANLPDLLLEYRTHPNSITGQKAGDQKQVLHQTLRQLLMRLWDEVSDETITRFLKIRSSKPQFTRDEFNQVKRDMERLAQSMQTAGWILPDEAHLIKADRERLLRLAKPRSFWDKLFRK